MFRAVKDGFLEVQFNFAQDEEVTSMTTKSGSGDGRVNDGRRHVVDVFFYAQAFAKLYLVRCQRAVF
jgi:hypothetical protein